MIDNNRILFICQLRKITRLILMLMSVLNIALISIFEKKFSCENLFLFLPKEKLTMEKVFSPYEYATADIGRSLIYTFKNVCSTVCSFDRPLFLFPHIQSVNLNKRLAIHSTASSFSLYLSLFLDFFFGSFHIDIYST